jgi:hypothetical protein
MLIKPLFLSIKCLFLKSIKIIINNKVFLQKFVTHSPKLFIFYLNQPIFKKTIAAGELCPSEN